MSSLSSTVKRMLAVSAIVGLTVPLLLRAVLPADEIDQHLKAYWQSLDEQERRELTENLKTFESLSAEEQQRIRDLHQSLEENSKQGRPFMMGAIGFHGWLNGMPPQDAQAIRETEDIDERLALIDRLRPQGSNGGQPTEPQVHPGNGFPRNRNVLITVLPDIMEAVRRSTPLTDREQIFISRTPGMSQHVATLIFAHKHAAETDPDWENNWPSTELVNEIQQVLAARQLGHLRLDSADEVRVRLAGILGGMLREADRDQQDRLKRGLLFRSGNLITPQDLERTMDWTGKNRPGKNFRRFPNRFGQ